ncbi:hypothetical protein [Bauldia litoralis]|uniref:Uncharacterized protein n=1 Tax=Bauldia litoralis TaxID=665467 RepID=A0A1G6D6I4_9HYPH|nr:hypothetical protein [Bauldia litoralis]SDB40753.1 hypothetical protein SAMN02982931_03083 [Bauldia litoralis]
MFSCLIELHHGTGFFRDFDPDDATPVLPYEWQLAAEDRNRAGTETGGFDFYNLVSDTKVVVAVDADMTIILA